MHLLFNVSLQPIIQGQFIRASAVLADPSDI